MEVLEFGRLHVSVNNKCRSLNGYVITISVQEFGFCVPKFRNSGTQRVELLDFIPIGKR